MGWANQSTFSSAVQQQWQDSNKASFGCLWHSRQICTAHVKRSSCWLGFVGTGWLKQGTAGAAVMHSTSQVLCTGSIQLAPGLTYSTSRKKPTLHSTSQPAFPGWCTPTCLLSCKDFGLSLALWCRGMQTSLITWDARMDHTGRQSAYQNSFTGSPSSLGQ